MKVIYAVALLSCFFAAGTVKAADMSMPAQQMIDQILAEASQDTDIEQPPSYGNTLGFPMNAQQMIDQILAEASQDTDIEQPPSYGNTLGFPMSAQQMIDQILLAASGDADIEQAPSEGNMVARFKVPNRK